VVVRQDEDFGVVRRIFSPPSIPGFVGPLAAYRAKHVAAHDPCADIIEAADGEIIVDAGDAVPVSVHALKGASREEPPVQSHPADAERVFEALRWAGAVSVDGNAEGVDSDFGHGVMLREFFISKRL
jgi:hypothetical protein